jgi:hypothetical protein
MLSVDMLPLFHDHQLTATICVSDEEAKKAKVVGRTFVPCYLRP